MFAYALRRRMTAAATEGFPAMARRPTGSSFRFAAMTALVAAISTMTVTAVSAHPHVWVTMTSEVVYAPDGSVTGVRHAWTFDDMYSAFATQGIESKTKGVFTRAELAPLATENATSLKEFEFFTFAKLDGRKAEFGDATDYWAEYKDSLLTLHFTLPLQTPAKAHRVDLEVYDPTYFVDFSFAKENPLVLKNAPANCQLSVKKPSEAEVTAKIQNLGEAFFAQADASNYGANFANKVSVRCR
jgi:ABC-type uncharacterized transport system substrate-binding protein